MDVFSVSFFGEKEVKDPFAVEAEVKRITIELMLNKEYVEFLVGHDSPFDEIVATAVCWCKYAVRSDNSALVLMLPSDTVGQKGDGDSLFPRYDEVEICEDRINLSAEQARRIRDRKMVDRSNLVVCYISQLSGTAYNIRSYARSQRKSIIDIGEKWI